MKTIQYKLQAKPGVSVNVPVDYAKETEDFVLRAMIEPSKLFQAGSNCLYLRNPGILTRALALSKNPDSLGLQDALYLRVCIKGCGDKIRDLGNGEDRNAYNECINQLSQVVQDLESQ